jgi:hypothetical protein
LGVVAPLATTGASIASSEPVSVTLVETMRSGWLSSVWVPRLSVIWRGQSAASAELIPKIARPLARRVRRQKVEKFTYSHPD